MAGGQFDWGGRLPNGNGGAQRSPQHGWEATAPVKLPTCHGPETRSGLRLGRNLPEGGIPRLAPPKLAPRLLRLPPILYTTRPHPIASCSKAPRGLSVQPRVTRVFTGFTTSPSPSSRQRSARYAIRAGRNLPDKEFRYLRTVIVTAAVHRGFGSGRRTGEPALTLPLNLPALGRRQPLYVALRLSRDLCFC